MEFGVCESACAHRHHHCLFMVFSLLLPWLFVVTTLSPSSSLSVGWMIISSTHPPSSKTSYFSVFRPFQIAFNTQCELVLLVLFFASSPPPSPTPSLSSSSFPPLTLHSSVSLNLYLLLGFNGLSGQTTSTFTGTKHNCKSYFLFAVWGHHSWIGNPIPSSISIYSYIYIDIMHTYISHITIASNTVICIPHPPTHGQPLKSAVLHVFLVYIPLLSYLPTSCFLHSVIFEYLRLLGLYFTYICKHKSSSLGNIYIWLHIFSEILTDPKETW